MAAISFKLYKKKNNKKKTNTNFLSALPPLESIF